MSEESLLVMKMVQDGKLSPEQGVEFLKALSNERPETPVPPAAPSAPSAPAASHWNSVDQMRTAMADMQQKLAEAQAKLSAAEAHQSANETSGVNQQSKKLPFGLGEINIPQIIDEAVRGMNAVRSEVVIGAKSAARQAQKEARRVRRSVQRAGDGLKIDIDLNVFGNEAMEYIGDPVASISSKYDFQFSESPDITLINEYGDISVVGSPGSNQVHVELENQSWALNEVEASEDVQSIVLLNETNDDGSIVLRVTKPEKMRSNKLVVDLNARVPVGSTISVKGVRGDIVCQQLGDEAVSGYIKSIDSGQGDIKIMQVRGATDTAPSANLYSASGNISMTQWRGSNLGLSAQSGDIVLDVCSGSGIEIKSKSGDIDLKSVNATGQIMLDTHSGDTDLQDVRSSATLYIKSMSGNVDAKRIAAANINVESTSGDIEIDVSEALGKLDATSISGNVKIRGSNASEVISKSTSGDCNVALKSGISVISGSISGNVILALPADSFGDVAMSTVSGSFRSDFELTGGDESRRYQSGRIGSVPDGVGTPNITLQTVSGDITLKRS